MKWNKWFHEASASTFEDAASSFLRVCTFWSISVRRSLSSDSSGSFSISLINFLRVDESWQNSSAARCILSKRADLVFASFGLNKTTLFLVLCWTDVPLDGVPEDVLVCVPSAAFGCAGVPEGVLVCGPSAAFGCAPKPPSILPMLKLFSKSPKFSVMSFLWREVSTFWLQW